MASSFGARHYVELSELKGEISRPPEKLGFHSMEDLLGWRGHVKRWELHGKEWMENVKRRTKSVVTC